jgi:cytochrome P450
VSAAGRLPPGPRPLLPGRLELAFWRDPLATLTRIAREFGDVAGFRFAGRTEVLVTNPDLIKQVLATQSRSFVKGQALQEAKRVLGEGLLTSEGELHLRQRRLIQPLFHRRAIAAYAETMVETAERVSGSWRDGETRDVHKEMSRLTLAIVGRTLLDADVEGEAREIGDALTVSLEAVNRLVYPFGAALESLPLPSTRRFQHARARLDSTVYRLIEERRRRAARGGDLLSLLLAAQAEDGGGMSDRQVRDEAMTIFLAGHETTANLLAWTWYLLARHQEVAALVLAELETVVGGGPPRLEHLPRLDVVERVLREALRLYPPAWVIGRRAQVDVELGGYRLPARTIVVMSPFVTQRDARWYSHPLRFDPERWTDGAPALPDYAFFPFGGGPRLCIGEAFAWMEAKLVLATLGLRWRFDALAGHRVELRPHVTLRPRDGLPMRLRAVGES